MCGDGSAPRGCSEAMQPDLGLGFFADKTQYRPKASAVAISVVISHAEWGKATQSERTGLYARALKEGVERIKDSKPSATDKGIFIAAVKPRGRGPLVRGVLVSFIT